MYCLRQLLSKSGGVVLLRHKVTNYQRKIQRLRALTSSIIGRKYGNNWQKHEKTGAMLRALHRIVIKIVYTTDYSAAGASTASAAGSAAAAAFLPRERRVVFALASFLSFSIASL